MLKIDFIDRQLISLLRTNARYSVSELANKLDVSRATVQNRITKLEQKEIITGYTAVISDMAEKALTQVKAHMSISLKSSSTKNIKPLLLKEPSVIAIHTTNGQWDIIVELEAPSLAEFDHVLGRIRELSEVVNSETSILLSSYRMQPT